MSSKGGILLPSGVLERLPFLREAKSLFFDFGMLITQEQSFPVVLVLTDTSIIVSSFPNAALPTRVLPLEGLAGIVREGEDITLKNSGDDDLTLRLPKADTLIVHLIDIQDRGIGRSLRLSAHHAAAPRESEAKGSPTTLTAKSLDAAGRALRTAAQTLAETDETALGVIRLGHASLRTTRPPREVDEGSDASSVQTIDHDVVAAEEQTLVDIPAVPVDSTALHRRLFYFFQHYDRAKLALIPDIVNRHRGRETQLMSELEQRYGPEPQKLRWETRDQLAHQLEINLQLRAQLRRAKDELLLLSHEDSEQEAAMERVMRRKDELLKQLMEASDPRRAGREDPVDVNGEAIDLTLLKVTRVSPALEAHFPAPRSFFAYLAEQQQLVPAAHAAPHCMLALAARPTEALRINTRFLAIAAIECGPYSVAVARAGKWQFVHYRDFWDDLVKR